MGSYKKKSICATKFILSFKPKDIRDMMLNKIEMAPLLTKRSRLLIILSFSKITSDQLCFQPNPKCKMFKHQQMSKIVSTTRKLFPFCS